MFKILFHKIATFIHIHSVGIYSTISIHLVLANVFLIYQIKTTSYPETVFTVDFSKQEEKIAKEKKDQRIKDFEKELDKTLSHNARKHELRNAAVDKSDKTLRDDRHKNPSSIYEEARQVQARLDASRKAAQQQQGGDVVPAAASETTNKKTAVYKGPSVLSYDLSGRKAMRLPVPVYQCQGGGDVTVLIEVDQRGYVVSTKIQISGSVDNNCLHEAAKRAASTSRFAANASAPNRQKGYITYRFIAQ